MPDCDLPCKLCEILYPLDVSIYRLARSFFIGYLLISVTSVCLHLFLYTYWILLSHIPGGGNAIYDLSHMTWHRHALV